MADSDSDRDPWCFLQGVECGRIGRRVYVDTIRDTSHRAWSVPDRESCIVWKEQIDE